MPQLLNFICTQITVFILNAAVIVQEQTLNAENTSPVIGKWEGDLVVNKIQCIDKLKPLRMEK